MYFITNLLGTLTMTNVLALSGGGFRGLYTIRVLSKIEEATGRKIIDQFQLLTGTSIGGVIALALAIGHSPKDLEKIFIDRGAEIFPSRNRLLFKAIGLFRPIYSNKGLKKILEELFTDKTMADLKVNVTIPTADILSGKPKFFKTQHNSDLYYDKTARLLDVALATSAAPVFFPIHETQADRFVDGALVGNAPGLFGWFEASQYLEEDTLNIRVLAIGTLAGSPNISAKRTVKPSLLFWLNPKKPRLLYLMMSQQEHLTNLMLNRMLGKRYAIIDETISDESANDIGVDDPSPTAQRVLLSRANANTAFFTQSHFFKSYLLPKTMEQ